MCKDARVVLQIAAVAWDKCHLALQGIVVTGLLEEATAKYQKVYGLPISFTSFSGTPDQGNPLLPLSLLVKTLRGPAWRNIHPNDPELGSLAGLNLVQVDKKKKVFEKLCEKAKSGAYDPTRDHAYLPLVTFIRDTVPCFQIRQTSKTR